MAVHKIGSIEVFEIDQNIDQYTRKQREQIINDLFKKEYQGKEISYLLNGQEIKTLINRTTRLNYKAYQHSGKVEKRNLYNQRQDIAFSGDYLELINNADYSYSASEYKAFQNKNHKINNQWHYFNKSIICNGILLSVNIDIIERNHKYYIYNTKLKEVDSSTISRSILPTSFNHIISKEREENNENGIQIEWISDDILKLNKEFPNEGITITAVYKTIKKEVNYYIEDAGDTKLIKKSDLPNELIDELDEIMEVESGVDRKEFNKEKER